MSTYQQLNVIIRFKRRIEELEKLCKIENDKETLFSHWGEISAYKEGLHLRFSECIKKLIEAKVDLKDIEDEDVESFRFEIAFKKGYIKAFYNVLTIKRSYFDKPVQLRILGLVEDGDLVYEYNNIFNLINFNNREVNAFEYRFTKEIEEFNSLITNIIDEDDIVNILIIIQRSHNEMKLKAHLLADIGFTEEELVLWKRIKERINKMCSHFDEMMFERIKQIKNVDIPIFFIYHSELNHIRPTNILNNILKDYIV